MHMLPNHKRTVACTKRCGRANLWSKSDVADMIHTLWSYPSASSYTGPLGTDYSRGRMRVIEGWVGDWDSGHGERYELPTCQQGYVPGQRHTQKSEAGFKLGHSSSCPPTDSHLVCHCHILPLGWTENGSVSRSTSCSLD